jgi:hypothetical protein
VAKTRITPSKNEILVVIPAQAGIHEHCVQKQMTKSGLLEKTLSDDSPV